MKKIDALLQKIDFYEKFAIYGNRKNFLKSFSQVQTNLSRNKWKIYIDYIINLLQNPEPVNQASLQKTNVFKIIDNLQAWLNERTEANLDHLVLLLSSDIIKHISPNSELYNYIDSTIRRIRSENTSEVPSPVDESEKKYWEEKQKWQAAQTNKPVLKYDENVHHAQDILNQLGYSPALEPDGKLGDKTKTALAWFKRNAGVPGDDQVAIRELQKLTQDQIDKYKSSWNLSVREPPF